MGVGRSKSQATEGQIPGTEHGEAAAVGGEEVGGGFDDEGRVLGADVIGQDKHPPGAPDTDGIVEKDGRQDDGQVFEGEGFGHGDHDVDGDHSRQTVSDPAGDDQPASAQGQYHRIN